MKTISRLAGCVLITMLFTAASVFGAQQPEVISGGTDTRATTEAVRLSVTFPASSSRFSRFPVATVNDEVITVNQLMKAVASSHEDRREAGAPAGRIAYMKMLDRLINTRLMAQEAVAIGLDELPEFTSGAEENARKTLTDMVMNDIVRDVKADPSTVEKHYRDLVVEWKIKSVLFRSEDDAKAMSDAIRAGKPFDDLAKAACDDKKATGAGQGEFLKPGDLTPGVAAVVSAMEAGGVSPVIALAVGKQAGFAILRLEEKRYPENTAARRRAEQTALTDKKNEVLAGYKNMLYRTRVTIREKLLDKLDYDSPKANLRKLQSDERVLVEVRDGETISVGALTRALQAKFFHGLEQAARDKYVNKAKREVLDKLIEDQLIRDEGRRRGIEKKEEYEERMGEYRLASLFGLFVERVVIPDVTVNDDELRSYYRDHKGEYTDPEMLKMDSLTFGNRRDAEAALEKLNKGSEFNWVRANAEGLVAPADAAGASAEGALIVTVKSLPPEMAEAVAGAGAGDFRLFAGPGERFSVLSIQEVIPARQKTYEEVGEQIRKAVSNDAVVRTIEDWFRKLRAAADIEVYLAETEK